MSSISSDDSNNSVVPEWCPQDLVDFEIDKDFLKMEIISLQALVSKVSLDLKNKKLELASIPNEASCLV
ncbi:hypothetical protein DAPPUDRAFT_321621 [Daphnia pulex]|uniref:Uncharacterized protein n=1 Tax=Daphnia pulex TaxID=6669 RepID=E9GT75_DAPPU|nr:hypothetical protein DAPPUDRAFT_321621 [Daphnia pulex]|eukprot:EFX77321.1 hypothetical protein DAPPUDRAFT_321621 [Daphnia pulex]